MLHRIHELLRRDWEVHVQHSLREGNRFADWLANYSACLDIGVHWLDGPPPQLIELLRADVIMVLLPRMVHIM